MNNILKETFCKLVDVNCPIIYIQEYDFIRVDELISECTNNCKVYEWNAAGGNTQFGTKELCTLNYTLEEFLKEYLYHAYPEIGRYLVLKNIHDYIEEPAIKGYLHLIAQRRLYGKEFNTTIIIVSPKVVIPSEIEKYVSFLEIPFPDDETIGELIDSHLEVNKYDKSKLSSQDRKELQLSLKGMTAFEVDRVLDMAMSCDGSLSGKDKSMILEQKKQMVKKAGLLELVDVKEEIKDIGGLCALKKYLERKSRIIKDISKAREFGVSIPKGVFIVGMPGCGKSLSAKAAASLFGVPLLKLDMGSMLGKYVGDSESNLRRAIRNAEAAAPCILWIDEIEKGFSGVGGDNDTITRMFGYFLSWMQDKDSLVYVIATANNADKLPPELKRKGRFDEVFCVNLPNKDERKEIFELHLKRRYKSIDVINDKLLKDTDGFNGADIEAVVCETIENVFLDEREDKNLTTQDLEKTINGTVSISRSCSEQIDKMKREFKKNAFKDAYSGKLSND